MAIFTLRSLSLSSTRCCQMLPASSTLPFFDFYGPALPGFPSPSLTIPFFSVSSVFHSLLTIHPINVGVPQGSVPGVLYFPSLSIASFCSIRIHGLPNFYYQLKLLFLSSRSTFRMAYFIFSPGYLMFIKLSMSLPHPHSQWPFIQYFLSGKQYLCLLTGLC